MSLAAPQSRPRGGFGETARGLGNALQHHTALGPLWLAQGWEDETSGSTGVAHPLQPLSVNAALVALPQRCWRICGPLFEPVSAGTLETIAIAAALLMRPHFGESHDGSERRNLPRHPGGRFLETLTHAPWSLTSVSDHRATGHTHMEPLATNRS